MLIHTLDLGMRSGFALGPAGKVPNSGIIVLRRKDQSIAHASYNLRAYLRNTWSKGRPDIFAIEAPMSLAAWIQNAKKKNKMHNPQGFEHLVKLTHEAETTAYEEGIAFKVVHRVSVMWAITGQQTWGSYEANKAAVIRSLVKQGMLPVDTRDDNKADAVAIHVVASGKFARCQNANFGLFAGN